jgi:hypothetical protein
MNCSDAQQFLYAYADGELTEGAPDARGHFESCGKCGRIVDEQRALRASLRRGIERVSIPTGLEDRIRRSLAADRPARRTRGIGMVFGFKPLAIAACIAIGVGVTWRFAFGGGPPHPVAIAIASKHKFCSDRASVHHHAGLPTTLAGLTGAMNAHEDYRFATIAPDLSAYGFQFESAAFCGLKDRKCQNGGHVVYVRKDGDEIRRFSVFSVPKAAPLDALEQLARDDGQLRTVMAPPDGGGEDVCIVLWHKDSTHYVCCGEVDPDQLLQMATTVYLALGNPQTAEMFVTLAQGR